MRNLLLALAALGIVGALMFLATLYFVDRMEQPTTPTAAPRTVSSSPPRQRTRAKPSNPPDADWLQAAREDLGKDSRDAKCGPYLLVTDVTNKALLEACELLAARLDALYLERYGLEPQGEPAEAIFLFAKAADFRTFAHRDGRLPVGYAGYTNAARGFTALYVGDLPLHPVLTTLAHELTHLVNRRALGPNLPPWISEGLADGIGDTATAEGFLPLTGVQGTEPQAARLRTAYRQGKARSLRYLTALDRRNFDREIPSFDYEQSALFVRYLFAEPELGTRFRGFLKELSHERYEQKRLVTALGVGWEDLDQRFEVWVQRVAC